MHPILQGGKPYLGAGLVFLLAGLLYSKTLAPTVTLVDSGELIVAAAGAGVAHPPGFPLYLLIAHLATLIPVGQVAVRVNAVSALFGALTAAMLVWAVFEALVLVPQGGSADSGSPNVASRKQKKPAKPAPAGRELPQVGSTYYDFIPPLTAGLLLACSRTLWSFATIAEVYTLNTFLIVAMLALIFRWGRAPGSAGILPAAARPDRWLNLAALVFGLALGVHHVTVGLMLPALGLFVLKSEGAAFFRSRRLGIAALWALPGLLVYAYLPFAAARDPILNWGDPRNLQRLWWHVSGRQYQVNLSVSPEVMFDQAGKFLELLLSQFGPWWLPGVLVLAVAGMIRLHQTERRLFWCLGLIMFSDLAYSLNYEIAEDKDAYYLPFFICCSIASGFGAGLFLDRLRRWITPVGGTVVLGAMVILCLVWNYRFNDRSEYYIARDYVENVLSTVGPGGMLLTRDWQVYSPFLYLREVERERRDVVAIDISLLRRSWYFDYLQKSYPELMSRSGEPVSAFLEDLLHWERDPDLFQRDQRLNQRISSRFYDMILSLVREQIRTSPVYVTSYDIATLTEGADSELTKALMETYQLVPQGLVFQLFHDGEFHLPAESRFQLRGLGDGTLNLETDDVFKIKVRPVYLNMLLNRGRYLAAHRRFAEAIEACDQALALDPEFLQARELRIQCAAALQGQPFPAIR
ncbi:MAG: DUF2723 domain-containing protein [Acidobacteria bacterium]|nr:DUF2723 domain-containing protein [Acidobacteriota bacterium]